MSSVDLAVSSLKYFFTPLDITFSVQLANYQQSSLMSCQRQNGVVEVELGHPKFGSNLCPMVPLL